EGHTDSKGSEEYNLALSQRRADSVKVWLIEEGGLKGITIITKGYGESKPVAPNTKPDGSDNPEGRAKNRRVEIYVSLLSG
ncbi:MAG: OmpA family protein, partial [Deltaproteobacteria bacterium]|nr:OmpA family protein [Deltaproteobacteria bacterium]